MYVEFQNRAWLSWLAKLRIIIITFLLGIELAITRLTTTNVPVRYFISIIALWYTIGLFEILLVTIWREYNVQARLQILTDVVFATALLYVTGDVDTSFNFLYPLIILAASIQLSRGWAYFTAAVSSVLFGTTLELTHFGAVRSYAISPRADDRSLHIVVAMNFVAYFAVAYLARNLSAKLRQEDVEALENLQALHENIINSMSGGLITTDLRGRISFLNAAGGKLLERQAEDLIGKNVRELFLDDLPARNDDKGELRYLSPTGKERIFGLRISELQVPDRGVLGFIYSFADLTEIRRLEREVRMRDRLSAVGRMASGIAHEIRNPLSSISGSVKVLSRISALDDEQRMLVDIVTRESERLNRIIADFLAYSREKNFKLAPSDLVRLLEDTLTLLENDPRVAGEGQARRIRVIRNFEAASATAVIDADKMRQVFWNLCENAVRAMRDGGVLTVSLVSKGSSWAISFKDNGTGMKPQQFEKIFEPFQSGFQGGTGLGLAIVYQIVEGHGGKVSARSTPGQGAEFIVELARAEAGIPAEALKRELAAGVANG